MKKATYSKLVKLFGKLYTLQLELASVYEELEPERDKAQEKFDELDEKVNDTDEPSDKLLDRHSDAENELDELDTALSNLEMAKDELESCCNEFTDIIDPSDLDEMVNLIENEGKKQNVNLPKINLTTKKVYQMKIDVVSFVNDEKSGVYRLITEIYTDLQKQKKKITFQWNGANWLKIDDGNELPYMNEEFAKDFNEKLNDVCAKLWQKRIVKGICCTISKEYD